MSTSAWVKPGNKAGDIQYTLEVCMLLFQMTPVPLFQGHPPGAQPANRLVLVCTLPVELWCGGADSHPLEGSPQAAAGLPYPHQCPRGML